MTVYNPYRILRIDSSARRENSISRAIGDEIVQRIVAKAPQVDVVERELAQGLPVIDADWVAANFTEAHARTPNQVSKLALSDSLIGELREADVIVVTAPIYNFSVPSVLKAWIDQVCRAGLTFRYTPNGPQGLLENRPVYLAMASGGVPFGSAVDFASGYLKQVFRFIGIDDVRLVGAERVASDEDGALGAAMAEFDCCIQSGAANVA
mgnify:CR=1 FL=1